MSRSKKLPPHVIARNLLREIRSVGCGDNSCYFVRPHGMATNGGCRCYEKIERAIIDYAKESTNEQDTTPAADHAERRA